MIRHSATGICAFIILCFIGAAAAAEQSAAQANPASAPPVAVVTLNGKSLFTVQGVLSFPAALRAVANLQGLLGGIAGLLRVPAACNAERLLHAMIYFR